MAQRYGGKYSPQGESGPQKAPILPPKMGSDLRPFLLGIPAVILLVTSINDGAVNLAVAALGAAALALSAWLTSEGLKAEAAYNARKVARRPTLPRKMVGAFFTGVGAAFAAYTGEASILAPALYGIVASALHVVSFGIDPLRDKNIEGIDQFQQDRVARVVEESERLMASMKTAIGRTNDRALIRRVDGFAVTAQKMFRTVEEDPRDLTAARKYLGIYLEGARDATVKYADLVSRKPDAEARTEYEALLTDLETNFAARTEQLMLDDRTDVDIEIKVLRDRLQRDGVRAED